MINFNEPHLTGKEVEYIKDTALRGDLSGNGHYTKKCQSFLQEKLQAKKCLLTSSCTDALEMCAILLDIQPGDEVIVPSYTFVSTANAFVLRGATIVFCDSRKDYPGIDEHKIEELITPKTKVIVPVHYAGIACDMDVIMDIAHCHNLFVVEDAAQAIDSFYKGKPLGSIGHLAAFSFHETKNIISGEGGLLVINDEQFAARSEIIWEKGTNRSAFWRGEVDKYGWVDVGSSFLPSELTAAFLWAQLESLDVIQQKRKAIWKRYYEGLKSVESQDVKLPFIPEYATNNAHMFYLLCASTEQRSELIQFLKGKNIHAVFHYLSLHKSEFHLKNNELINLPATDYFSDRLVRLPFYVDLEPESQHKIIEGIKEFFNIN